MRLSRALYVLRFYQREKLNHVDIVIVPKEVLNEIYCIMDCSNVETNSTMICVISFNRRIHGHHKLLLANLSTTSKGSTERLRSLYRNAIRNPQGKDLEFIQSNLLELNTNHQMNNGLHNNLNGGTMKILKDLYVLRDASLVS